MKQLILLPFLLLGLSAICNAQTYYYYLRDVGNGSKKLTRITNTTLLCYDEDVTLAVLADNNLQCPDQQYWLLPSNVTAVDCDNDLNPHPSGGWATECHKLNPVQFGATEVTTPGDEGYYYTTKVKFKSNVGNWKYYNVGFCNLYTSDNCPNGNSTDGYGPLKFYDPADNSSTLSFSGIPSFLCKGRQSLSVTVVGTDNDPSIYGPYIVKWTAYDISGYPVTSESTNYFSSNVGTLNFGTLPSTAVKIKLSAVANSDCITIQSDNVYLPIKDQQLIELVDYPLAICPNDNTIGLNLSGSYEDLETYGPYVVQWTSFNNTGGQVGQGSSSFTSLNASIPIPIYGSFAGGRMELKAKALNGCTSSFGTIVSIPYKASSKRDVTLDLYHQALLANNHSVNNDYQWYSSLDGKLAGRGWAFEWPSAGSYYLKSQKDCEFSDPITVPAVTRSYSKNIGIVDEGFSNPYVYDSHYLLRQQSSKYFDGFGDVIQEVDYQAANYTKDIITPHVYNSNRYEDKVYLPAAVMQQSGEYMPNIIDGAPSPHSAFYTATPGIATSQRPFLERSIEISPSPTFAQSDNVGESFQGKNSITRVNRLWDNRPEFSRIKKWRFNKLTNAYESSAPLSGELLIKESINPENVGQRTYVDDNGIVWYNELVKYTDGSHTSHAIVEATFTAYDEYFRPCLSATPMFIDQVKASNVTSFPFVDDNSFITGVGVNPNVLFTQTVYDDQGRISKRLFPDEGWEYYIYDYYGNQIMYSPPRFRGAKWLYSLADLKGRKALTGLASVTPPRLVKSPDQVQGYTKMFFEDPQNRSSPIILQTGGSYNTSYFQFLGLTPDHSGLYFYDNYDAGITASQKTPDATDNDKFLDDDSRLPAFASVPGLPTVSKVYQPTNGGTCPTLHGENVTVNFYSEKLDLIQTVDYNDYFGNCTNGTEKTVMSYQYNFLGKAIKSVTRVSGNNRLPNGFVKIDKIGYDKDGRLIKQSVQIDDDPEVQLFVNTYNDLGQLIEQKLPAANPFKYKYDIQGRLKSINDFDDMTVDEIAEQKFKFYQKLYYETSATNRPVGFRNTPTFDGKITSNEWSGSFSEMQQDPYTNGGFTHAKRRAYNYEYDYASRLTKANYATTLVDVGWVYNGENPNTDPEFTEDLEMYRANYDKNGNINLLTLRGSINGDIFNGSIDNLSFGYPTPNTTFSTNNTVSLNQFTRIHDDASSGAMSRNDFHRAGSDEHVGYDYDIFGRPRFYNNYASPGYSSTFYDERTGFINQARHNGTYGGNNRNGYLLGTLNFNYSYDGSLLSKEANLWTYSGNLGVSVMEYHSAYSYIVKYDRQFPWIVINVPYGRIWKCLNTDPYDPNEPDPQCWRYEAHAYDYQGSLRTAWGYHVETSSGNEERVSPYSNIQRDVATMELTQVVAEESTFDNLSSVRLNSPNLARTGSSLARISAQDGTPMGPLRMVSVQAGDSVSVEAPVYYKGTSSNIFTTLAAYLASVLSGAVVPNQEGKISVTNPLVQLAITTTPQALLSSNPSRPKAYLRYVRFADVDSSIVFDTLVPVNSDALNNWSILSVQDRVSEPGQVVVYLASEGGAPLYADDFTVTTYVQDYELERHYYPYGLAMGDAVDVLPNDDIAPGLPGWTGQEEPDYALFGYAATNFGYRHYNYQTGRWLTPDPARQYASPYSYCDGDPVNKVDRDGRIGGIDNLIGAGIGGTMNLVIHLANGKVKNVQDGLVAFGIGALAGAIAVETGGASLTMMGVGGFVGGAVAGAVGAGTASMIQGVGNALYFHEEYTSDQLVRDVLIGGATGGIIGGLGAVYNRQNFWTSAPRANGYGALSLKNGAGLKSQGWQKLEAPTPNGLRWAKVEIEPSSANLPDYIGQNGNTIEGLSGTLSQGNAGTNQGLTPFTKSNLAYGQYIHRLYKADLHAPNEYRFKEFNQYNGIRPDFVDFNTRTIYELKPNNPRGIKDGLKQLQRYKRIFEQYNPNENWNTVLDTY